MDLTEIAGNLIVRNGKILLLYRRDEEHWEVPGGKVKEDESPTEAAVREAKEEIGVEVELEKPFYTGEFQKDGEMYIWNSYVASINGEPEIQDADCSCRESACSSNSEECCEDKFEKLEWFEGSELDEIELASNLEMVLPALRKL